MLYNNGARVEKGNGSHSFWSNLLYHYHNLRKWEPMIFWLGFLTLIPWTVADLIGNYLPSAIVEGLQEGWALDKLLLTIGGMIFFLIVTKILDAILDAYMKSSSSIYREHYSKPYMDKKMNVDYDTLEEPEFNTAASAAYTAIYTGRGINDAVYKLPLFLMFMVPAVIYIIYLAHVKWWFPVIATLTAVLQIYMLKLARQKHSKSHPILSDYSKKLDYITKETMENQTGKDIRIFKMQKWLNTRYQEVLNNMNKEFLHIHYWYFL